MLAMRVSFERIFQVPVPLGDRLPSQGAQLGEQDVAGY